MANWISAAAKVFQRAPEAEPQTYELRCSCGRVIGGVRASTYQQVTCPTCHQRLFVLPASPFPRPKPARAKPKASPKQAEPKNQRERKSSPGKARAASPAISTSKRPKRLITPVRLVVLAIAGAALLTVWGISRSRNYQRAELEYAEAVQKGRTALHADKDLEAAAKHFRRAATALDVLGFTDPPARVARQLAAETGAAISLVDMAPGDLLREAFRVRGTGGDSGWREIFQFSFRDRWMVIDAPVRSETKLGVTTWFLDYPIVGPDGRLRARIVLDSPLLRDGSVVEGSRVILAAQLEDLRADPDAPESWRFVLRPQTAFLWSSPDVLELLNQGPADPETRQTLARQTHRLNLPAWEEEKPAP